MSYKILEKNKQQTTLQTPDGNTIDGVLIKKKNNLWLIYNVLAKMLKTQSRSFDVIRIKNTDYYFFPNDQSEVKLTRKDEIKNMYAFRTTCLIIELMGIEFLGKPITASSIKMIGDAYFPCEAVRSRELDGEYSSGTNWVLSSSIYETIFGANYTIQDHIRSILGLSKAANPENEIFIFSNKLYDSTDKGDILFCGYVIDRLRKLLRD